MDLNENAIQEVIDLFDIKYVENEDEVSSADIQSVTTTFSDLEGDISDEISRAEDKGEVAKVETTEETVLEEESKLETIEDLIASSVEEAVEMTKVQKEEEIEAVEEASAQLEEDFDAITITEQSDPLCPNTEEKVAIVEVDAFQKDLNEIILEKEAKEKEFDAKVVSDGVELSRPHCFGDTHPSPAVLEDENIDVIPCKDSEGNIKGEILIKDVKSISWDKKGEAKVSGGEIVWNTVSPTELYDGFYAIKTDHINKFSGGEQLNFEKLYSDLFGAKVDTSTEVLDQGILTHKMDEVMHCIERVAMIQVQINQQYFVWKRFVELLRGALARVSYLKPVLKQDGLILEHMGDVEFYADRLAAIKDSADKVMKTLQMAFESLSRKVSIMLTVQSKHTTRMAPNSYSPPQEAAPYVEDVVDDVAVVVASEPASVPQDDTMDDYDGFEMGTKVVSTKAPTGTVGWGEIW